MKRIFIFVALCCVLLLASCKSSDINDTFWGSFTPDKTYSFDHELYAVQTVDNQMIVVTVYNSESGERIDGFLPARAEDFWGICWEKDSYNIWTQSADLGISCFEFQNGEWIENENLSTPDYIISKYNKEYANDAELQKKMYKSPIEPE